jgi:segregation and condensation protein B
MDIIAQIESILFVASKPLKIEQIARIVEKSDSKVQEVIETLMSKYNHDSSGIHILYTDSMYQMATNPNNAPVVECFIKDEIVGELTRAQLETLTVVAYRGPITRPELEQIRGVNCAIIIRNLMIRGLIVEQKQTEKIVPEYNISLEALRHLGIESVTELPKYDELHVHEHIEHVLE